MGILDFSLPPDFSVIMGDAPNALNLTSAIGSMRLSQPLANLQQPLLWSASIVLNAVLDFGESLDKVDNFSRWQRGKHAIRIYMYGALIATLRLKTYHFDVFTGEATLTATDVLGLLDFDRTFSASANFARLSRVQQDGVQFYNFMPIGDAIAGVLVNGSIIADIGSVLNGLPDATNPGSYTQYLQLSQIVTGDIPLYTPDGRRNGWSIDQSPGKVNPIAHAQEICASLGYWLWVDPFERIRFAPYRPGGINPVRRYGLVEVEEFRPKEPDFDQSPPAFVVAIGSSLVSAKTLNKNNPEEKALIPPGFGVTYPIITEAKGDGGIVVQRTTRDGSDADPYSHVLVERSLASLMPAEHPDDNSLATASNRTIKAEKDGEGYYTSRVTTDLQPLGVVASSVFGGSTALVETIVTETWKRVNGVLNERTLVETRPEFAVFDDKRGTGTQTFYAGEIETWTPIGTRKYEHQLVKTVPKGTLASSANAFDHTPTIVNPTEPDFVEAPPLPPSQPAPAPVVTKVDKAAAGAAPAGEAGYAGNTGIVRFSFCSGLDNVRAIAMLQIHLEWQRHAAYNVTRPFDPRCDLGYVPFQREDVYNRACVRDGYTITIASDGLSVSYTGNLIGKIPGIPDPYEAPALVPTFPTVAVPLPPALALAIAPVPALAFSVGVPISPFSLVAAGGSP